MKKTNRIIALLLSAILLLSGISILSGCGNKKKEIEEALVVELEQRIEKFTQGNPADNVKYEITIGKKTGSNIDVQVIYNIETSREPEIVAGKKFYTFYDYDILFDHTCELESVEMWADLYGEVYVNGELRKTENKIASSNSGSKKCSVCGKSYSSGGTSNMCSQCYKNYKYASKAAGY